MQTASLTHAHPAQNPQQSGIVPPVPAIPIPPAVPVQGRQPRRSELDSLLKTHIVPGQVTQQAPEPVSGIFLGLRVALFFNAGLGIAALLAYEAWSMLAH